MVETFYLLKFYFLFCIVKGIYTLSIYLANHMQILFGSKTGLTLRDPQPWVLCKYKYKKIAINVQL